MALVANTDWYIYGYRLDLAKRLKKNGDSVVLISPPGEYSKSFADLGFVWKPIWLSRKSINVFSEFRTFVNLFRLYRTRKYDLVHHFTIKIVIYGSIAAKFTGVKRIVNSITGLGHMFTSRSKFMGLVRVLTIFFYKWALRGTTVIFQNSDDLDFFTAHKFIVPQQGKVIRGSGIDTKKYRLTQEPEDLLKVVLVSRLLWDKGVGEFVEAAKIIAEKKIKASFILVGEPDPGNASSISRQLLNDWTKKKLVEWKGWQHDMPRVYMSSNIVCLPSYREGLPKTLIEAAASGRPIVTTDVPGCREVVIDGVNGFLVPIMDVDSLVIALERLINDPGLRRRMGRAGREVAEKFFSVDRINEQTLALYRKVD